MARLFILPPDSEKSSGNETINNVGVACFGQWIREIISTKFSKTAIRENLDPRNFCAIRYLLHVRDRCHNFWNQVHIHHDRVHLAVWWRKRYTRPSPTSPGGSKIMFEVKRTEWDTAWERGYWSLTYGPEYMLHHAWAILTQYSQDITCIPLHAVMLAQNLLQGSRPIRFTNHVRNDF